MTHPFTQIVPQPEGGPWSFVPVGDGFAAPQHFIARGDTVTLEVEVDSEGIGHCRSLFLRAPEGDAITGESLRRVAIGRLTKEAVAAASREWAPLEEGGKPMFRLTSSRPTELAAFYRRYTTEPRRPRRGSPISEENLREVARVYREAVKRGDPPTESVAAGMDVARSTAARWVAAARKRGLLGPAMRGRGGEREGTDR